MRGARSPRARICGQGQGIGMVTEEIQTYKQREDALILAHYYVPDEVQALADYVGDSYYLAKAAAKAQKRTVVFCGVRFMGESAKILNPASRVLLPAADADCPMAHMEKAAHIASLRANIRDLAVVCYINSDAKLKALSDVCVTSSNAVKIVSALPNRNILFIPDENLGSFVRAQVPHKNFFFSGGYCPVHAAVSPQDIAAARRAHPKAAVLMHPECVAEVRALADNVGSTAQIIAAARENSFGEFIVCTEPGALYELKKACCAKTFYPVSPVCADMKKITPERVLACLKEGSGEVSVPEDLAARARRPLERMLEMGG